MKILVVSPYFPHPRSGHGGGTYLYGVVSHLSRLHEVTLISFADKRERKLAEDLRNLSAQLYLVSREKGKQTSLLANLYLAVVRVIQLLRSSVLWEPYYVSKFSHPQMAHLITQVTKEQRFDIVHIEYPQMGQYVSFVRSGKKIWHDHDVAIRNTYREYRKAGSPIKKFVMIMECRRWLSHYRRLVPEFDHILTLTLQDEMLLRRVTRQMNISYLPVGLDVPEEIPRYEAREAESLLFIGTFSHHPNLDAAMWLCREIFPLVQQQFPRAILYIIGSNPTPSLQELAKQNPGIKILGFVEDVEVYFRRCSVFIAPLRLGGGVKIKVLHAMAQGIPVVTTKIGAEGIEGIGKNNILIANTAQGLVEHVCRLFRDRELAAMVGRNGYETVEHRYSWDSVLSRLENIYRDVAGRSESKI